MINLKPLLTNPEGFFTTLKKETSLKDAYLFYVVLSAFSLFMSCIMYLLFGNVVSNMMLTMFGLPVSQSLDTWLMILFFFIGYIFNLGLIFLWAGITHVWILIFGGKEKYTKTFNMYVYSSTPQYLFNWIPFVSFFAWIYSLILLIIGTSAIHKFSKLKSTLIFVVPLIVLGIIILIFIGMVAYFGTLSPTRLTP